PLAIDERPAGALQVADDQALAGEGEARLPAGHPPRRARLLASEVDPASALEGIADGVLPVFEGIAAGGLPAPGDLRPPSVAWGGLGGVWGSVRYRRERETRFDPLALAEDQERLPELEPVAVRERHHAGNGPAVEPRGALIGQVAETVAFRRPLDHGMLPGDL